MSLALLLPAVFLIAVFMTLAGRGGGNFYVLLCVLAGAGMHQAAATGQLIMCATSVAALLVFQKHKNVAWPMAVFLGLTASTMAFVGGFFAHLISGPALKLVFGSLLVVASLLMLFPLSEAKDAETRSGLGIWTFRAGGALIRVNLWLAVPLSLLTGLFAGMVGVSGGSFLIPLMVLACRMPMKLAVGTAAVMVGATAGMGFLGHLVKGGVELAGVAPLALVAVVGGLIGGKWAIASKPKALKLIFALTTMAAAVLMFINALL